MKKDPMLRLKEGRIKFLKLALKKYLKEP